VRLQADITERDDHNSELAMQYGIRGVPTAIFIDKHGRILKREVGYVDSDRFLRDLREVDELDGLPEVRATPPRAIPPQIYARLAAAL